jgi:DNA modification methylase
MAVQKTLTVTPMPLAGLTPNPRNARTHSERQIAQIMGSIDQFGFTNPVLVDCEGMILAGHGRVEAARRLGLETVPTIPLEGLTAQEMRAYVLADNKLALNSGWDPEILKIEIGELSALDLSFEIDLTGFGAGEIDVILSGGEIDAADDEAASTLTPPKTAPVTRRGDVWILGKHRLLCGDSREASSFETLMGEEKARMVFSDPPYNVRIDGFVGGSGTVKHAEFAMASGEMTKGEFVAFLTCVFANQAAVSLDGALHYQCMDWRHMGEMLEAGESVYSDLKNLCVWTKDNGGMGAFYRSKHELVFVWKVGDAPHLNNVELGKNGRYRTNVWDYRSASKTGAEAELAMHPTVKPVPMIVDAIKDATRRGEIVLDAFGGSGSTLIAAQRCGRYARLVEYEGGYCDVTIGRWERQTNQKAILEETGETFAQVKARRELDIERMADLALAEVA